MIPPRVIRDEVFVLVDAYRSGSFLASTFLSYGYNCVHVQSIERPIGNGSIGGPYLENIRHQSMPTTLSAIKKYKVSAVIPGHEVGVELADALSEFLNTSFRNGIALSSARRDKARMRAHAMATGISCPRFDSFTSATEAREFAASVGLPVVVKPTRSAGGQGVRLCNSPQNVYEHAETILVGTSVAGELNNEVIVEVCIEGHLYMVNTVSLHGVHYVTDLWLTKKRLTEQGAFVFEYSELEGPTTAARIAAEFTAEVLTKFGISYGPAHTEVFVRDDGSPILVEIGARIQGNMDPSMTVPALGTNQVIATAQCYLEIPEVLKHPGAVPDLKCYCRAVDLIVTTKGELTQDLDLTPIRQLKSFWSARIDVKKGSSLDQTSELLNVPGSIVLISPELGVIKEDYRKLRAWESEQFRGKLSAQSQNL